MVRHKVATLRAEKKMGLRVRIGQTRLVRTQSSRLHHFFLEWFLLLILFVLNCPFFASNIIQFQMRLRCRMVRVGGDGETLIDDLGSDSGTALANRFRVDGTKRHTILAHCVADGVIRRPFSCGAPNSHTGRRDWVFSQQCTTAEQEACRNAESYS